MALRGNLRDFALADLFQLVALSRKTGVLRIHRLDDSRGSVWFKEGDVYFAESNWRREGLGVRLVAAQRITRGALERAVQIRADEPEGRRLGSILVDEGYISRAVLEAFVQEQLLDTVFDLMRWDDGEFDFEVTTESPEEDIGLSISIENIAMESGRRLEEWERIKKKVPSVDIVFKMAAAPGEGPFEISLKPVEWNVLLSVDGARSVSEVAVAAGMTDFDVAKVIYGLFSAGLLEIVGDDEARRVREEQAHAEAQLERPGVPSAGEPTGAAQPTAISYFEIVDTPEVEFEEESVLPSAGPGISELGVRYELLRGAPSEVMSEQWSGPPIVEVEGPVPFVEMGRSPEAQGVSTPERADVPSPPLQVEADHAPSGVTAAQGFFLDGPAPFAAESEGAESTEADFGADVPSRETWATGAETVSSPDVAADVEWIAAENTEVEGGPLDQGLPASGSTNQSAWSAEESAYGTFPGYEEPTPAEPGAAAAEQMWSPALLDTTEVIVGPEQQTERGQRAAGEGMPPETEAASPAGGHEEPGIEMDHAVNSAISDEISALTGVAGPMAAVTGALPSERLGPKRSAAVDRDTLLGIIEGIKRL